jgi:hypothetical protein
LETKAKSKAIDFNFLTTKEQYRGSIIYTLQFSKSTSAYGRTRYRCDVWFFPFSAHIKHFLFLCTYVQINSDCIFNSNVYVCRLRAPTQILTTHPSVVVNIVFLSGFEKKLEKVNFLRLEPFFCGQAVVETIIPEREKN